MKPNLNSKISLRQILSSRYAALVVLIALPCLAYGLLVTRLGFYWDDWPVVFLAKAGGNFWQYYLPDRPLFGWPDLAYLLVAGVNPIAWQVLGLLTRIAAGLCFWWVLTLIWPRAKVQVFAAALLFAIYPVFLSQSMAITYKTHFVCLALFLLSLALMILAVRKPRYFILFFVAAILLDAVQLATLEYFWGLELVRPVILWMVIHELEPTRRRKAGKALLLWLPFLLMLGGVLIWRFAILEMGADRNTPALVTALLNAPLSAGIKLFLAALRDGAQLLVGSWLQVFSVQASDGISPTRLLSWGLAVLAGIITWFILRRQASKPDEEPGQPKNWSTQALTLGIFALAAGMLPVWLTNRLVTVGTYSDRYAIPALVSASLFSAGLLDLLISKASLRLAILALLVGLSTGLQFRTANEYRWDWTYQKDFYWQLHWRAPAIQPQTAILSGGGLFRNVTKYSLAAALNSLYPAADGTTHLPYWAFELDDNPATGLEAGATFDARLRTLTFSAPVTDSLVLLNESGSNHCLLVLSEGDRNYPGLAASIQDALPLSNLGRISDNPEGGTLPDPAIFGPEPAHTWCYTFEKADLARQLGDWGTVIELGNQASLAGLHPNSNYEWLPFIDAYLHMGEWEKAQSLTLEIAGTDQKFKPALCAAWQQAVAEGTISTAEQDALLPVAKELECPLP